MHITKQRVIEKLYQFTPTSCADVGQGGAAVAFVISDFKSPSLTLCVKAQHLRKHAGEVSLPGGKLEQDDCDWVSAACRELAEETGIELDRKHFIGYLNQVESLHHLSVMPSVFWSDSKLLGSTQGDEISRVFNIPMSEFIGQPPSFDVSLNRTHKKLMPRWHYRGEVIWGLTALIIEDFFQIVFDHYFQSNRTSML